MITYDPLDIVQFNFTIPKSTPSGYVLSSLGLALIHLRRFCLKQLPSERFDTSFLQRTLANETRIRRTNCSSCCQLDWWRSGAKVRSMADNTTDKHLTPLSSTLHVHRSMLLTVVAVHRAPLYPSLVSFPVSQ